MQGNKLRMFYVRVRTIPLSQGYHAIVDDDDFEKVSQYKWVIWKRIVKGGQSVYGIRSFKVARGKRRTVQLHRFIMDV